MKSLISSLLPALLTLLSCTLMCSGRVLVNESLVPASFRDPENTGMLQLMRGRKQPVVGNINVNVFNEHAPVDLGDDPSRQDKLQELEEDEMQENENEPEGSMDNEQPVVGNINVNVFNEHAPVDLGDDPSRQDKKLQEVEEDERQENENEPEGSMENEQLVARNDNKNAPDYTEHELNVANDRHDNRQDEQQTKEEEQEELAKEEEREAADQEDPLIGFGIFYNTCCPPDSEVECLLGTFDGWTSSKESVRDGFGACCRVVRDPDLCDDLALALFDRLGSQPWNLAEHGHLGLSMVDLVAAHAEQLADEDKKLQEEALLEAAASRVAEFLSRSHLDHPTTSLVYVTPRLAAATLTVATPAVTAFLQHVRKSMSGACISASIAAAVAVSHAVAIGAAHVAGHASGHAVAHAVHGAVQSVAGAVSDGVSKVVGAVSEAVSED